MILLPILLLLGFHYSEYFNQSFFSFPHHLLSCIFCAVSMLLYAPLIFNQTKIRITGAAISLAIIISMSVLSLMSPFVYNTDILVNNGSMNVSFDDSYKVYFADDSFGDISIEFIEDGLNDYVVKAGFKRSGATEFTLEAPNGKKEVFKIDVKRDTFEITKK